MEIYSVTHNDVLAMLPDRDQQAHKGDFGRVLLLCGSKGYTGAAALAAMGALRSGSGLVHLGVPECIYAIEAVKLNEAIVFPLPDHAGMLAQDAIGEILQRIHSMDAVLIGPGLGNSDSVLAIVREVLQKFKGPVVLDADGINVLSGHINLLRDRTSPTVLTPHPGEFQRITGKAITDRVEDAWAFSNETGALVVLKGHQTVITDGRRVCINLTGNPGMAVGGCGDVLAGMIVGLIGQGIPLMDAVVAAVWLHGASGDLCADEFGQYGMLPTDMLQVLPRLMK